jgi:hypothetical protein
VGAEYIIMEKVRGIALAERWGTMNALERYKVIDGTMKTDTELESLKLPAYGSLFLRNSSRLNIHVILSRRIWTRLAYFVSDLHAAELYAIRHLFNQMLGHVSFAELLQSMDC